MIKDHCLFEGLQASAACPSVKKSVKMAVNMEHWWNDDQRVIRNHSEKHLS
jgi:hypothetical protein